MPVVGGIGIGRVFHYIDILSRELEIRDLEKGEVDKEYKRILRAMGTVRKDLTRVKETLEKEVGNKPAGILEAHRLLLNDPYVLDRVQNELDKERVNAEQAVRNVFRVLEHQLRDSSSIEVQEKAADIRDVGRRVLRVLIGVDGNTLTELSADSVIFCKRLLPSDTVHFSKRRPMGIVTQEGGPSSHMAIIARSMGIPSVSNIKFRTDQIPQGARVIIDGDSGHIVLNPSEDEFKEARRRIRSQHLSAGSVLGKTKRRQSTYNGENVTIGANVSSPEDIKEAVRQGCDEIGLFRVEPIYLAAQHLPDEDELFRELSSQLGRLRNTSMRVVIRLADLGGDKSLPYLQMRPEHSSLLGLRGIRLLLENPTLLRTQLRAILRISVQRRVDILVPMVTVSDEMVRVRRILREEMRKLKERKQKFNEQVAVGAMIEVPAAAMGVDSIIRHSDFLSIGTNDLVQYFVAADRESQKVAQYYKKGNDLVLKLVRHVVEEAQARSIPCNLCGELAADLKYTASLLNLGLRSFSMQPKLIPRLKATVLSLSKEKQALEDRRARRGRTAPQKQSAVAAPRTPGRRSPRCPSQ